MHNLVTQLVSADLKQQAASYTDTAAETSATLMKAVRHVMAADNMAMFKAA